MALCSHWNGAGWVQCIMCEYERKCHKYVYHCVINTGTVIPIISAIDLQATIHSCLINTSVNVL